MAKVKVKVGKPRIKQQPKKMTLDPMMMLLEKRRENLTLDPITVPVTDFDQIGRDVEHLPDGPVWEPTGTGAHMDLDSGILAAKNGNLIQIPEGVDGETIRMLQGVAEAGTHVPYEETIESRSRRLKKRKVQQQARQDALERIRASREGSI